MKASIREVGTRILKLITKVVIMLILCLVLTAVIMFILLLPAEKTKFYSKEEVMCHWQSGWSVAFPSPTCYKLTKVKNFKAK